MYGVILRCGQSDRSMTFSEPIATRLRLAQDTLERAHVNNVRIDIIFSRNNSTILYLLAAVLN